MKRLFAILLTFLIVLSFAGCGANTQSDNGIENTNNIENRNNIQNTDKTANTETRVIIDAYGREVAIPKKINSIIATGSGALRMVSYLEATDLLIGVEQIDIEYETSTKRDYAYVYHKEFKSLPIIGKGGGTAYTAYPEEIIKLSPDIIVSCYQPEALEQLSNETGIPVVSVRYTSTEFINDTFYSSMRILGDILQKNERCEDILSFIDLAKDDLNNRTKDVPDETKPTAYTGAVTFSGAHGFSGTYSNFGPFIAINALNVADEMGQEGSFEVDLEKVLVWDPDIIFLDPGNMNLVNEEYNTNPNFFKSLSAIQNGNVYTMPSFNNYSTNITYCLMNSYFAGTILFPEQFSDIDMKQKGNEILNKFLNLDYFDEMQADGLYYGKINIG